MKKDKLNLSHKQKAFPNIDREGLYHLAYWQNDTKEHVGLHHQFMLNELDKVKNGKSTSDKAKRSILNKMIKNLEEEMGDKLI